MGRNSGFRDRGARRAGLGVATAISCWLVMALLSQVTLALDVGGAARRLEERLRLEEQLRGVPAPGSRPPRPPERRRDADTLEPWELVSV